MRRQAMISLLLHAFRLPRPEARGGEGERRSKRRADAAGVAWQRHGSRRGQSSAPLRRRKRRPWEREAEAPYFNSGCPAPKGAKRASFPLAYAEFFFQEGPRWGLR